MRHILGSFLVTTLFAACAAVANDAPPSDASIQELATLSHSQELFNGVKPRLDAMLTSSMKEAC